jgi:long-chain acyl-CoA synthetase
MENFQLSRMIHDQAKKYGNTNALYHRNRAGEEWNAIHWNDFASQIDALSNAFIQLGVKEQQRIAQFSQNKAENLIVDFALFAIRATMVPMYATSTAAQVEFIVNDAEIELIFVGDQQQYNVACEVLEKSEFLKKIIVFDKDVTLKEGGFSMYFEELVTSGQTKTNAYEVSKRQNEATDEDLYCILYTSGTTGNPKGVMMPHSCFKEAMRIHTIRLTSVTDKDRSLAFLPLSHVFERTWCYFCLYKGVSIYINQFPTEIQQAIREVRPTLMCAVPRFWEKVYAGVNENIEKFSPFKQGLVTWAIAVGKIYNLDYLRAGKTPSLLLKLKYTIADKLIFAKLKHTLGIENANILPAAGAKLSDDIAVFFRSLGVPIVYGYGLTESTATVACYEYVNFEVGAVGSIMPDLQVRIGEENEIQLKGKTIFPGYYKNPEATKAAFTSDGWFKTGDAGYLRGNNIVLTERIKDLFKTSNGKYIAPQEIETRLVLDKYIEQAATIGDDRNFVTAIIFPCISELEKYAKEIQLSYRSTDELLQNEKIKSLIAERIKIQQTGMAPYELIKKFSLIKQSFAIETGELTNTLKIRRAVVMQKYKTLIDDMYAV